MNSLEDAAVGLVVLSYVLARELYDFLSIFMLMRLGPKIEPQDVLLLD